MKPLVIAAATLALAGAAFAQAESQTPPAAVTEQVEGTAAAMGDAAAKAADDAAAAADQAAEAAQKAAAAAETTAATILYVTGHLGMPVSTTHTITTSIIGVGAAKRWNSIQWTLVERIVWAWVFTIPVTGVLAFGFYKLSGLF